MKIKHQKFRLKIPSVTENLHLIRDFTIKIALIILTPGD